MTDTVDCYTEKHPTAIKQHRCHECHRHIEAGEKYTYITYVYDGRGWTYKRCRECELVWNHAFWRYDGELAFTELIEIISEELKADSEGCLRSGRDAIVIYLNKHCIAAA